MTREILEALRGGWHCPAKSAVCLPELWLVRLLALSVQRSGQRSAEAAAAAGDLHQQGPDQRWPSSCMGV